jgi:PAS domain S-box-containing protein
MVAEVRANTNVLTAPVAERDLACLAENIPALCWIADADGYIFWYNQRWYDYTGTTPAQMQGWGWQSVHDPRHLGEVLERWKASISSAQPFEMVFSIRGADGVMRPFLTRINPVFDETGSVIKWCGINTDISLQVQAEHAYAKTEQRFRLLADTMPQMVWSAPPDGVHDYFNARWYEFTGLPVGTTDRLREVLHAEDAPAALDAWYHAVGSGQPYHAEFRLRHRSGAYRWVLARAQAERDADGSVLRWYGTCTDIEAIVQARQVLKRSRDELEAAVIARTGERNLLATLVETTDVMIMALAPDYTIMTMNRAYADAFVRALGVRPKVGDNLHAVLADQPEHLAVMVATWNRALAGEEFTVIEARGDPARLRAQYEITFRTLRNESGAQIGAFQFAHDVTQRLHEQALLAQAQEALLQSQKLESMGQLTGGVAHDFNNLLTPIIGSLDSLRRRGIGGEREQRLIYGAYKSAERAKVLVHRLLAFARRQPLQAVPIDIGALVAGLTELLASTLGPQIILRVEVEANLPAARADPGQLEMAILNLSVNARDAMESVGEMTISATRPTDAARAVPALPPGQYVRIAVRDTGRGMDEATRARAIEPFFSTKGVGRGTGLGLSMAHGLALQLGGALTIDSTPGQGTEVAIWLPEAGQPGQIEPASPAPQVAPAHGVTALVVDDEEYIRASTVDMLSELGFDVREAESAEHALRALEAGPRPDILITDHLMPGMTGVELARAVMARYPAIRILIISGFAEADGIDASLPRLTKPFVQSDLARALLGTGQRAGGTARNVGF